MDSELAFVSSFSVVTRLGNLLGKDVRKVVVADGGRHAAAAKRLRLGRRGGALGLESKGRKHHENTGAFTSGSSRREMSGLVASSEEDTSDSPLVSEDEVEVLEGFEDLLLNSNKKKVVPKTKSPQATETKVQSAPNQIEVLEGFEDLFADAKSAQKGKRAKAQVSSQDKSQVPKAGAGGTSLREGTEMTNASKQEKNRKAGSTAEEHEDTGFPQGRMDAGADASAASDKSFDVSVKRTERRSETLLQAAGGETLDFHSGSNTEDDENGKERPQSSSTAAGRAALNLRAGAGGDIAPESIFLRLADVSVAYRGETVVKKANLDIRTGDRIAIVGKNGSGKTSLLRILAGLQEPAQGELMRSPPSLRVGFLRQEFHDDLNPSRTLREELLSALTEANAALTQYHDSREQSWERGKRHGIPRQTSA
ncbi:hypothetical protein F1559_001704 [Cyanidiococcus yangmingshanensis]|uniref:ABC transporter domain-containing protein n=1 Tax=Cyanidiococcus yangmingshanensis TaxID=2690220 RepID=A0A7J7IGC9_9RHOD|nr:hypothetical protein F1559_001704 [Cyanidiococcus yangmingshanensis]